MSNYIDPRGKLYGHLDRLAELQAGRTSAPVNAEIDLSNRCSLGCEWCHFAYTHTRGPLAGKRDKPTDSIPGGDLMDAILAKEIVAQLDMAGVRSVTWTGGGEPTLHPQFDSVIKYTADYTHLEQGLYTNGVTLTPDRVKLLKERLTWVYVSLDSASAEDYHKRKGVDKFNAAVNWIRALAEQPGQATIGVGFLLDAENYTHVYAMAELGIELGADYVQFRPAISFDMQAPDKPAGSVEWARGAIEQLETVRSLYPDQVTADIERFRMLHDWRGHGYEKCYWSQLQTVITPAGLVWICVNKRENSGALLGDLRKERFTDIWKRQQLAMVDGDCRVLCRGHLPNLELHKLYQERTHGKFI